MLIEKKLSVGDVVSIKLVSGEELIGKIKDQTGVGFLINKPLVLNIVAIPAQDGSMQHALQLSPFMFGLDEKGDIIFPFTSIIAYTKTREEIKQSYIKETSSIAQGPSLIV